MKKQEPRTDVEINIQQFYTSLGVPISYLNNSMVKDYTYRLKDFEYPTVGKKTIKIKAENQYKFLGNYIKKVKQGQANGLFCVCCNNTTLAGNFTFALFRSILQKTFSKKEMKLPYWHVIGQGFTDNVENGDLAQLPNFLVIEHITDNSSFVKVELAKTIANKYNYIPVVMICLTRNPTEFLRKNFLQPSRVIYLDMAANFMPPKKIKQLKQKTLDNSILDEI